MPCQFPHAAAGTSATTTTSVTKLRVLGEQKHCTLPPISGNKTRIS